ncbi:unnamed protein product [Heterobilharzia americana]|nr:unnamed protein product [Heterobilharzia americana]
MEIGPNLCVWPVQSGISHDQDHGFELNSMQNISPIVQQKNSFVFNRPNDVLELESDSESEVEASCDRHHHHRHHHFLHQGHQQKKHKPDENHSQPQWNTELIHLSIDDDDDDDNGGNVNDLTVEDADEDDDLKNDHNVNTLSESNLNDKQFYVNGKNDQNPCDPHNKNNENKDYTCGFCGSDFNTADQVERHVLMKHSDNLVTFNDSKTTPVNTTTTIPIESIECVAQRDIKKSTENDKLLTSMLNTSSSNIHSDDQVPIINDNNNNSNHNNTNNFPATSTLNPMITDCPLCDRTFVGRRSLNIHLNKTHSIRENSNYSSNNMENNAIVTSATTINTTNTKLTTNNSHIDVQQSKCNSPTKLTRSTYSHSLRGSNSTTTTNNNNNTNSNKTTTETVKVAGEKSTNKIVIRPPLLPRPSRLENSKMVTITSPSRSNTDSVNMNLQSPLLSDTFASKNNETEESMLHKSWRTVYAVSPPLATEHNAAKKSSNSHTKTQNPKNKSLTKTHLNEDSKSISPVCSPPSSSSSTPTSTSTFKTPKKPTIMLEEEGEAFFSSTVAHLKSSSLVNTSTDTEHSYMPSISESNVCSFQRSQSYPLHINETYKFLEDEDVNTKCNFSNGKLSSLNFDIKPINPCELSTLSTRDDDYTKKKSETMDTSLRTSDGLYKCRICKRLFANRYSLTGHYKSHYEPSQKPYCCDDCGQRYTSPSNLHYHRGRNCPVLKLKAIQEGKLIPTSVHNTKLLELKALRAVERKALMNKLKDQTTEDKTSNEIKNTNNELNRHQPPVHKKSRFTDSKSNNHLKSSKNDNTIEFSDRNFFLKDGQKTETYVSRLSISTNSTPTTNTTTTTTTTTNNNNNDNNNTTYNNSNNVVQHNEDGFQMHEILRLFLMHAYQSDELRQQLLSLTSSALLNALVPTNGLHSGLSLNQNVTSNQQLLNLLSGVINSVNSMERTDVSSTNVNGNSNTTSSINNNNNLPYMQHKSIMETVETQSTNTSPRVEEPTDLTSTSRKYSQQNEQSTICGVQCPICHHQSNIYPDLQALDKHMFLVHGKYPRSSTGTTTPPIISGSSKSFPRCHSLTEPMPSNIDRDMEISNSLPITSITLMQQKQRHQESQQSLNYTEGFSSKNNHNPSDTIDQSSSSSSVVSPWGFKPSSLVSCTDCDREFSTYTAFRVHHTKSHQQTSGRQYHRQHSDHHHHHHQQSQSQRIRTQLNSISQDLPPSISDQCNVTYMNDNDSE